MWSGLGQRESIGDFRWQELVIAKQQSALIANLRRDQRSREYEAWFRLIELADLVASCVGTDRVQRIDAVEEACVWLCRRIGVPLDEPWVASVQVALKPDATIADVRARIQGIVASEVVTVSVLTQRLTRGELTVC